MPPADSHSFQSPRGTRDFYPIEMARRRWIEDKWRRTAIRHGFQEIDGPTFEHLDLYTVKSGESIVSELFSFRREGGEKDFALRPEFTPTLARMVAAKANSLPKPIKWFSIGPYFRAERPQRGRLREFLQWNCDVLGDETHQADADLIAACAGALEALGLTPSDVRIRVNDRQAFCDWMTAQFSIPPDRHHDALTLVDQARKIDQAEFLRRSEALGVRPDRLQMWGWALSTPASMLEGRESFEHHQQPDLSAMFELCKALGLEHWLVYDLSTVRGLAYYTGTVFEVHETTGAERAIAGGGRYDNLVELFGGPPIPAVGFAMGDVVLSLVLQSTKGQDGKPLMPSDDVIADRLGLRPDVYVLPGADNTDSLIRPTVAQLRRAGLHARASAKATRNLGKLLKEASDHHARFALILLSDTRAKLKDLDAQSEQELPLAEAIARLSPPARN